MKVQLEQGVLGYCNSQDKSLNGKFPCIPMRDLSLVLNHSCSLMRDITKPHVPWGQHILSYTQIVS